MPTIFREKVTVGSTAFNDVTLRPNNCDAWIVDVCDGWKSTPEPNYQSTPIGANRDGSFSADFASYSSRFITIGGAVHAADLATAEALHDMLVRDVFPRNQTLLLTRYENTPKFLTCKRSAAFETDWSVRRGFRWNTTLTADDPLKYGTSIISASGIPAGLFSSFRTYPRTYPLTYTASGTGQTSVGIFNAGTAYSRAFMVNLTGPLSRGAWRLRNDTVNGEISFDVGLSSTDSLDINFATETAFLNGSPIAYSLSGDFWALAPGSNTIRLYADYDPATDFTVVARSAWE